MYNTVTDFINKIYKRKTDEFFFFVYYPYERLLSDQIVRSFLRPVKSFGTLNVLQLVKRFKKFHTSFQGLEFSNEKDELIRLFSLTDI